jgi:3-methyladenine DNA glycosylase AlkD
MATVASVATLLKKKGTEKMRAMYARHGMAAERCYGVSMADLKIIAKTIKGQQALAGELYATGMLDAMYLAGMVADGRKMSAAELQSWAEGAAGWCTYSGLLRSRRMTRWSWRDRKIA